MTSPRQLGYRMPAEWELHAGTWLSWPRPDSVSFRGHYDDVVLAFAELARALAPHETVNINIADEAMEADARKAISAPVRFHRILTNEPWCRDHGPIFVRRDRELAVVDWDYNAYGHKFSPFDSDDIVPQRVAATLGLPCFHPGIILEGGSIEVNDTGTVIVTESCLLHPNRNPSLNRLQIEQALMDYLGVTYVLWLASGLAGDDTDGHVDNLARFVDTNTVVAVVEEDPCDENYAPLRDNLERLRACKEIRRVVELPTPGVLQNRGQRIPASYANFYIANHVVIAPTFGTDHDQQAIAILQDLFPTRRVIGLDSRAIISGGGSFHCLTQQQPTV